MWREAIVCPTDAIRTDRLAGAWDAHKDIPTYKRRQDVGCVHIGPGVVVHFGLPFRAAWGDGWRTQLAGCDNMQQWIARHGEFFKLVCAARQLPHWSSKQEHHVMHIPKRTHDDLHQRRCSPFAISTASPTRPALGSEHQQAIAKVRRGFINHRQHIQHGGGLRQSPS